MLNIKQLNTDKVAFFSDIHGDIKTLTTLENQIMRHDQDTQYVFLGDAIDGYGKNVDSKAVLSWLVNHPNVIWVPGNHDMFLYKTAKHDKNTFDLWKDNGGKQTLRNLGYYHSAKSLDQVQQFLLDNYADVIETLDQAPNVVETPHLLGVHAGLDSAEPIWQNTAVETTQWVRDFYYESPNLTGKIIVSGHTPVQILKAESGDGTINHKPIKLTEGNADRYLIDGGLSSSHTDSGLNLLAFDDNVSLPKQIKTNDVNIAITQVSL